MSEKLIAALAKAPEALSKYEQITAEAASYPPSKEATPEFQAKVREFKEWLNRHFGPRVTGQELALARVRRAAARKRTGVTCDQVKDDRPLKVSL